MSCGSPAALPLLTDLSRSDAYASCLLYVSRESLDDTACSGRDLQDREGARHCRRRKPLPLAAQILKGISLVTFFVPAKKVTRSSAGGVEALASRERKLPAGPNGQRKLWLRKQDEAKRGRGSYPIAFFIAAMTVR